MANDKLQPKTGLAEVDQALVRLQEQVSGLAAAPLAGAILIKGVAITATQTTRVPHKLGRPLVGWAIIKDTVPAKVYESSVATKTDLYLTSTSSGTIDIAVF